MRAIIALLLLTIINMGAPAPVEAASYTEEPYWVATFDKGGDYSMPACVLMGRMKEINSPLWLSFRGGRGGFQMFLGGTFKAKPGPVPVAITVDDDAKRWLFNGIAELNGTTVQMPDDAGTRALFARLKSARTLHLNANGNDYALGLNGWAVAYPEWDSCRQSLLR